MEKLEDLKSEGRINNSKAGRIERIIQSEGSGGKIVVELFDKLIPKKRVKYSCRICEVPKKGHDCPYCEVCSTSDPGKQYKKGHECLNCSECYFREKRKKKIYQKPIGKCNCKNEHT